MKSVQRTDIKFGISAPLQHHLRLTLRSKSASYLPGFMLASTSDLERNPGYDPGSLAWKAKAQPLYQSRIIQGRSIHGSQPSSIHLYLSSRRRLGFLCAPVSLSPTYAHFPGFRLSSVRSTRKPVSIQPGRSKPKTKYTTSAT